MASVAAPYGFRPVDSQINDQGALGKVRRVAMTTNSANAIVKGNFITLASGQPSRITATPTAGTRSGAIAGMAWQFEYTIPGVSQPYVGPLLPANAVTNGYTNIIVSYLDDPNIVFQVQSDQSITLAMLGLNVAIGNFSSDNLTTFTPKNTVTGAPATTATLAMRIVGFVTGNGSAPADAFTDILVQYNVGTHLSQIALGG